MICTEMSIPSLRRVKRIAIKIITVLIVFNGYLGGTASQDATAKSLSDVVIEGCISSAFQENTRLFKFSKRPRVNLICGEDTCLEAVSSLKRFLPKEILVEKSTTAIEGLEVQVFLGSKADSEFNEVVARISAGIQSGTTERDWGETGCLVHQVLTGYQINKLLIAIQSAKDEFDIINCAVIELVRGSGGQAHSSYADYARGLRALTQEEYESYKIGANSFLRIHWAPYLTPGMTKEAARRFLIDYLK